MNYHFPDYYSKFTCIGGQCPDTCCAGWNIEIDSKSLAHYQNLLHNAKFMQDNPECTICDTSGTSKCIAPAFARQLKQSVNFQNGTFRLNGRRCALLNADNLCDLYIHAGKDSLCRTCRTYPRHQEEFGNVREISLSLSCPEAARIILSQPSRPAMLTKSNARICPEDQEIDGVRLQWLLKARELLLDILWQPLPLALTVSMALAFAHDLQRRFRAPDFCNTPAATEGLARLTAHYLGPDNEIYFRRQCAKRLNGLSLADTQTFMQALLDLYSGLDPIVQTWPQLLDQCACHFSDHLFFATDSLPARQLLTYYIQVYFLGAVYDDDLWEKTVFAILSWFMTGLLAGTLQKKGDMPVYTQAAYLYSRQVENYDANLGHILHAPLKSDFHLFQLLNILT